MGSGAFGLVWPQAITHPHNSLLYPLFTNQVSKITKHLNFVSGFILVSECIRVTSYLATLIKVSKLLRFKMFSQMFFRFAFLNIGFLLVSLLCLCELLTNC